MEERVDRMGLENISVFGLPPVEHVNLVADLGLRHMSVGLTSLHINPHNYECWSLVEDAQLRRDMITALRDRGVSISLGEGLTMNETMGPRERAAEFDIMCELGVKRINIVSLDPDRARTFDKFAAMAEMAAAAGVEVTTEFAPGLTVADLPTALAAVRHVNRPGFRLLIDTMHFTRSGAKPEDLAAIDPGLIGYIQLCDAPREGEMESYMREAMTARLPPGQGELPLFDVMAALPRDLVVGLEIPQLALAQAGVGPFERLRPAVDAARALLARLPRAA